jgi:photosystem II stability/assembly factor-like uncharacterized protein
MNPLSMRVLYVVMLAALAGGLYALVDITKEPLTDKTLYDLAWDSTYSKLVVVGEGDFVAVSVNKTDTIWQKTGSATPYDLRSVVWTGSIFMAVGQRGTIRTSTNGINWISQSSGTSYDLYSIYWDGSRAIAAGDSGTMITSSDGVSWSDPLKTHTKLRINDMAWNKNVNNRLYVAVGNLGLILTSTNLSDWTSIKVDGVNRDLYSITWTGSEFIIVGEGNMSYCACLTSKDGKNWTVSCVEPGSPLYSVVWTGSAVIAVGYDIEKKTVNGDWELIDIVHCELHSVITKGDQLIAVGSAGYMLKSSDGGVTWTLLGPHTGIVPDTRGVRQKSAFSIAIAGRSLWVTPSVPCRGRGISVDIYSVIGRKASSAVYRADADRIEIPLSGLESGAYVCIVTGVGEKVVRPFTILKKSDPSWLRSR